MIIREIYVPRLYVCCGVRHKFEKISRKARSSNFQNRKVESLILRDRHFERHEMYRIYMLKLN